MRHSSVEKLGGRIDPLLIEAREDCGGGGSVEAFIVETNPDLQFPLLTTLAHGSPRTGKPTTMDVQSANVKSERGRANSAAAIWDFVIFPRLELLKPD
jgi:hypothetical protein